MKVHDKYSLYFEIGIIQGVANWDKGKDWMWCTSCSQRLIYSVKGCRFPLIIINGLDILLSLNFWRSAEIGTLSALLRSRSNPNIL